jgi:hypothetical protein
MFRKKNYTFSFKRNPFNSNYEPDKNSRLTTNFTTISKNLMVESKD